MTSFYTIEARLRGHVFAYTADKEFSERQDAKVYETLIAAMSDFDSINLAADGFSAGQEVEVRILQHDHEGITVPMSHTVTVEHDPVTMDKAIAKAKGGAK